MCRTNAQEVCTGLRVPAGDSIGGTQDASGMGGDSGKMRLLRPGASDSRVSRFQRAYSDKLSNETRAVPELSGILTRVAAHKCQFFTMIRITRRLRSVA